MIWVGLYLIWIMLVAFVSLIMIGSMIDAIGDDLALIILSIVLVLSVGGMMAYLPWAAWHGDSGGGGMMVPMIIPMGR